VGSSSQERCLRPAVASRYLVAAVHRRDVVRRGTTNRSPFGDVRETRRLGRLTVVQGITVVAPEECLVQLAPGHDPGSLGDLIDDVSHGRRHLLDDLRDRYADLARSRIAGIGAIREALAIRGDGYVPPPGALERSLHRLVGAVPAMPPVLWEATPPWLEPGHGRVDALVPDWRLVLEADGRDWHTRVRDFERDRERDALALAHGHATLRLTWHQLVRRPTWSREVLIAVGADRVGSGAPDGDTSADTISRRAAGPPAAR
jgi:hypothetical protein